MFDRDLNTLLQYRETSSKLLKGIEPTRNSVQNYYFLFVFFTWNQDSVMGTADAW